jgi:hypothetical protein
MAPSLTKLRAKIATKVFDAIGSQITVINTSSSTDMYGDATTTIVSSTTTNMVPFNMVETESFQPFGDLQAGELDIIIPYDVVFSVDDFVDYDSNRYIIKQFEKYPYQNGVLAYAVRVAKVI